MNKNKKKQIKQAEISYFSWIMKNIIFAGIATFILIFGILKYDSHNYMYRALQLDMDIINKHPLKNTSLRNRSIIVLKNVYTFMEVLKNKTSEDAVILYPEFDSFFPENEKHLFDNKGVSDRMWAIRFLYPRIIIKQSELNKSPYRDKITDVTVVNGRDYEYIPYKVNKQEPFGIFPVKAGK